MRIKTYAIEAPEMDTEIIRGTAKVAQRRLRELHRDGVPASLRCVTSAAERRAIATSDLDR